MGNLSIRYKYIKQIVDNIYLRLNITKFPINIVEIINSFDNIKIISYNKFMLDHNLTREETFEMLNSDEGCTDYFERYNKFIIYYNDLGDKSEARIRWTLTHELGHILCNHYSPDTRLFCDILTEKEYNFKEGEANYFTGLLLSNPIILDKLNIKCSHDIEVFCDLSSEASRYRYDNYKKWRKRKVLSSTDKCILNNFQNFLNIQKAEYNQFISFMNSF